MLLLHPPQCQHPPSILLCPKPDPLLCCSLSRPLSQQGPLAGSQLPPQLCRVGITRCQKEGAACHSLPESRLSGGDAHPKLPFSNCIYLAKAFICIKQFPSGHQPPGPKGTTPTWYVLLAKRNAKARVTVAGACLPGAGHLPDRHCSKGGLPTDCFFPVP